MICIYHNKDLDGYCSGAIIKRKYPDAVMLGWDYGQPLPFEGIDPIGEDIILIDISFPMPDMFELAEVAKSFTWIDHHISAINDYNKFPTELRRGATITAILENGIAACEGAWKYLFPDEFMPTAVMLAGKYDTWRNQDKYDWDNAILPFQFGMRMFCNSPETFPPQLLEWYPIVTDSPVYGIINDGKLILSYQKTQNERACKSSFEIEFEGLRAICLNNGGANSQVFDSVYDETKHDLMIPFVFTGKHWTFSIYTTKDEIDCSVIAKSKGGGGHKKAAGFQLKGLPDEFKPPSPMSLPASEIERIRIDAQKAFPITDTSTFSGLMQDGYVVGAQAEAVRGREMAIAFMEWTSDRGWLLHPDCDEDEERMWYKPSDDFNIPDERMFGGQLYDLYILETLKRKG